YYIVHDHWQLLGEDYLLIFEWERGRYVQKDENFLPLVGLGLTLWEGEYQDMNALWLRWCDENGELLLTGSELAQREAERAQREAERAQNEASRAQRLAAKLRELGLDPETI
ncbi:MAG: Uma2 family endonuclease, partial [Blastocatellia bacterium]